MRRPGLLSCVVTILVVALALAGCRGTPSRAGARDLPDSMKGYELYSWRAGDTWNFTLMTGTNRNKTEEEITTAAEIIAAEGYVSVRVESVADLKALLDRLPAGTPVFWIGPDAYGTWTGCRGVLELPDASVIRDLVDYAEAREISLTAVSSPPSP